MRDATDRQGSVLQVVRSTGQAVGRYRYEGVKPATVQEHEAGDFRLRAELMLTVAGQPNLPDVNLLYIRGQWYSGLTDTAVNASGSVAVNPYPVMGATAVNEPAGSWFYRNVWSPLGSALSDPRMALFGVLDGLTFGILSWATDKLTLTNSKGWTDDEKAAFGAGSVVGMIGSAILTGGATAALRGAAAAAKAAETAVTLSRAAAVGRGYVQASAANGLYTAGEGVAKWHDDGLTWQSGLMIGGGLLGARLDLGGLAKAGQLGRVGRGLLGAMKLPERATLGVLKVSGKVAEAVGLTAAAKAVHGKAFAWAEKGLDWAVHGQLSKVSTRAEKWVSAQLEKIGFRVCFAADMPMRTAAGHVLSQDVREGTRLLSRDEWDANGAVTEKVVEAVFVREGLVVEVVVNGVRIRTTAEHPLFRFGDGWTAAQELRAGDTIRLEEGWATVEKVIDTGSWETVYNFRVADYHTYFVGCDEWGFAVWAHNTVTCSIEKGQRKILVSPEVQQVSNILRDAAELGLADLKALTSASAYTGVRRQDLYIGVLKGKAGTATLSLPAPVQKIVGKFTDSAGSVDWAALEKITLGSALQSKVDRVLRNNPFTKTLIDPAGGAKAKLLLDSGSMVGTRSAKGKLLRPDYQLEVTVGSKTQWAVFDLTTALQAGKINKYDHKKVGYLVELLYS